MTDSEIWERQKAREREELEHVAEIRRRHPSRSSNCGAVLAEIFGAASEDDRLRAISLMGSALRCQRGIGQLERLIRNLERRFDDGTAGWEEDRLITALFKCLGFIDTPRSHAVLERAARTANHPMVRANALEGMCFESETFDTNLVLSFLKEETSEPELLSALYALQWKPYLSKRRKDARRRIGALLAHPSHNVRLYAVETLGGPMIQAENLDLIAPLVDDPSPAVRRMVEDMIANSR